MTDGKANMADQPDNIAEAVAQLTVGNKTREEIMQEVRDRGWIDTTASAPSEFEAGSDWTAQARVYQYQDEYGDVQPRDLNLEKDLYESKFQMRQGEHLANLDFMVRLEGPTRVPPMRSFETAELHPVVLDNVQKCGYGLPTPVQAYTIPAVLQGMDVVAVAQTGSGKTGAYLIPAVSRLMGKARQICTPRGGVASPAILIIVPTRELALQIYHEARRITYRSALRPCVVYGGYGMREMRAQLQDGCELLVGTPGRIKDLMQRPEVLSMARVKITILDEADELIKNDWSEEIEFIVKGGDSNQDADHSYLMFSATFNKASRELAREYLAEAHAIVRIGRAGSSHMNITQDIIQVDRDMKKTALVDLIMASKVARTIVFCNSKPTVDLVDDHLFNLGISTTCIHGDIPQAQRENAMRAFRAGNAKVLVATSASGRGLDINGVEHVINYDLPDTNYNSIEEYVHCIGRTGRIGHKGLATSFYNERDEPLAQDLVNLLIECRQEIPDFLQSYVPDDGAAHFDDDDESETDGGAAVDAQEGGATEQANEEAPMERLRY